MKFLKEVKLMFFSKESPFSTLGKVILFLPGIYVIAIFCLCDLLNKPEERWM